MVVLSYAQFGLVRSPSTERVRKPVDLEGHGRLKEGYEAIALIERSTASCLVID